MEQNTKKELISYYKWIVSLSIFIITITISLISASGNLYFSKIFKCGLFLLGISIFFNWLIIKNLVIIFGIEEAPAIRPLKHISKFFLKKITKYGLFQNWMFLIGISLIFVSFLLGLNNY